jgi:organic radical activating enzyme
MTTKWFPIKTETACQLKWNWSTVRLHEGTTSSCHRVNSDTITPETFPTFHNTPKKLVDRELMLQGQWPSGGCEYCQQIEQAGGTSDRLMHLQIPNLVPVELETNINAVNVSPKILEVYFNNICNLSCVYCWDGFSSKIEHENKKFGKFDYNGVIIENTSKKSNFAELNESFWTWFTSNCSTLSRLHILGGEPFYQQDFYRCLDFFESNPCPDLEFNVISNLMISTDKFRDILSKLKKLVSARKIKRFDLTASIDSFGAAQEYVRYGLDLAQWRLNFDYAASQKWITLNINQTLTSLVLDQITDLINYVNDHRATRSIGHYFSLPVFTYDFLEPKIFGPGYFDKEFKEILDLMPQCPQRDYMQGIQMKLSTSTRDNDGIRKLGVFLDEIDRRRNLNWKQTFPWLANEVKNVV